MPFTTYTELKQSISDYLARSDLTSYIPDFIRLAEVKIDRRLMASAEEASVTGTTGPDGRIALPADVRSVRTVQGTGSTGRVLKYITPDDWFRVTRYGTGSDARFYTVSGGVLKVFPASTFSLFLIYQQAITPLSDANPSNWILLRHPDVYLYGALAEAEPFMKNDNRVKLWLQLFSESLAEAESQDVLARSGSPQITPQWLTP